jgi:hypothetical protein
VDQTIESPEFDAETVSHKVHGGKLDCAACHVRNTMACYNCHFDTFLKTGSKKDNYVPMKDWLLLINYDGKVTSGSAMTLVYQNEKFIAYIPYYTHSVAAEGRTCDECHRNEAVNRILQGKKVPVVSFQNGKVIPWKGAVPVMKEKLDWVFLNKIGEGWEPVPSTEDPKVQFAAYGTPLTPNQFQKLAEKVSPEPAE